MRECPALAKYIIRDHSTRLQWMVIYALHSSPVSFVELVIAWAKDKVCTPLASFASTLA